MGHGAAIPGANCEIGFPHRRMTCLVCLVYFYVLLQQESSPLWAAFLLAWLLIVLYRDWGLWIAQKPLLAIA